ncbi:MAG TPA: hypothetical protein VI056_05425 [Candidatus Limnocylindria bacterium]
MSARKRAAQKKPKRAAAKTPSGAAQKKPQASSGPKTFTAHGHRVAVKESAEAVVITIDGQTIPGAAKIASGEYHSLFLPFRGYASATELARALASQVGSTLMLDTKTQPKRRRTVTKKAGRGRS